MFLNRLSMTLTILLALGALGMTVGQFASALPRSELRTIPGDTARAGLNTNRPTADKDKPVDKDKPAPIDEYKGTSEPADVPLQVRLIAKKTTYTLDLGGKTEEEYRKWIEEQNKHVEAIPPTPTVDLVLEFRNTSDHEQTIRIANEPGAQPWLSLEGPGAVNLTTSRAFTNRRGLSGKEVKIAAGKTYEFPIKDLSQPRAQVEGHYAYWTQVGEYELKAHFWTVVDPQPPGSNTITGRPTNGGVVTFSPAPIKITVVEKKK